MPVNYIVFDGGASPASPVVQVAGQTYFRIGATDLAPTHGIGQVQAAFNRCDEGQAAPATCPACGIARFYQLDAADLAAIQACATCNISADTPWDGKFGPGMNCSWLIHTIGSGSSLDNKALNTLVSRIALEGANRRWILDIRCFRGGISQQIWYGEKSTGLTPAGAYSRVSGCSANPGAVTVNEI